MPKTIMDVFNCVEITTKRARFVPQTYCWRWFGPKTNKGYGQAEYSGREWLAHRLSFMFKVGHDQTPIVCHTCDNRWCVNPEHLFAGDHSINALDRIKWKVQVTLKDLAEIKESPLPSHVLAKQWGLSIRQIEAIRPMRLYRNRFKGKTIGSTHRSTAL
jgi:hypothetical protein